MITELQNAAAGLYKPRGYEPEQQDAELAYLAKALGGPCLLFALNDSLLTLPSARTLCRHMTFPVLLPSVLQPSKDEVQQNVTSLFGSAMTPDERDDSRRSAEAGP